MADHDSAGQGASVFRAFLRSLPDDIARARDDGAPIVVVADRPLPPHSQRLMDSLGVEVQLVNVNVRTAKGADGGIVVLAAFCQRCEEEAMPNRDGCCSFCGLQIVDLDRLSVKTALAAMNSNGGPVMEAICKIDGCDELAVDRAGPYGRLCATHKEEKRAAGRSPVGPAAARSSSGGASSVAEACKELVKHGRTLDRARAQLAAAPETTAAKAAFDEATRRASTNPTPEALKRVSVAIVDLQQVQPRRARVEDAHSGALQVFKDQLGVVMGLIRA